MHRLATVGVPFAIALALGQAAPAAQTAREFREIELRGPGNLSLRHQTRFDQVELRGGGELVLRHGPEARIAVTGAHPTKTRLTVDTRGRMRIDACEGDCGQMKLRIDIVTPHPIEGVAIERGGVIRAQGRFPAQASLAASIGKGGLIDVTAIPARDVAASVSGGGALMVHAQASLAASVQRGGSISYAGDPQVTSAVSGGGSVGRIGR